MQDGRLYIKPTLQNETLVTTNNNLSLGASCTGTTFYACNAVTNTTNGTIVPQSNPAASPLEMAQQSSTVVLRSRPHFHLVIGFGQQYGCSHSTVPMVHGPHLVKSTLLRQEETTTPIRQAAIILFQVHYIGVPIQRMMLFGALTINSAPCTPLSLPRNTRSAWNGVRSIFSPM